MKPLDLIAAPVRPLILSILATDDNYGYKIMQQIKTSMEKIPWKDGMLYPLLRWLYDQHVLESEWRISADGRKRRYYRLSKKG